MTPNHGESKLRVHLSEDEILELAHGGVTNAERERLLAHARECAECTASLKERVADRERARAAFDRMVRDGEERELAGIPNAEATGARTHAPAVALRRRWWTQPVMQAAAGILVVGMLALWRFTHDPLAEVARQNSGTLTSHPEFLTLRRGTGPGGSELAREGVEAYARGDLARAEATLAQVAVTDPAGPLARLYLASTLVRRGHFDRANQHLAELKAEQLPEPWADEHRWLGAVASLGSGQPSRADSLLQLLEAGTGEWPARARKLRLEWQRTL